MLSNEQIEFNKQTFLDLISKIDREGFRKSELIDFLNRSDFFTAPASTKYHAAYEGGLCEHCLNVFYNMVNLVTMKHLNIAEDSIIIAALCHDLSKINFYKKEFRNKKIYSPNGSKSDEGGRFDWVAVSEYTVIPEKDRFVYSNHETTAEYMARYYIPLTWEESTAIMNHMGGMSFDSIPGNLFSIIYGKNALAVILHLADTLATYIDEETHE